MMQSTISMPAIVPSPTYVRYIPAPSVAESQQRDIHPSDLVDFVTACKYGKPYQVVQRKSPNDCIQEAVKNGLKGMDMADYAKKCYG